MQLQLGLDFIKRKLKKKLNLSAYYLMRHASTQVEAYKHVDLSCLLLHDFHLSCIKIDIDECISLLLSYIVYDFNLSSHMNFRVIVDLSCLTRVALIQQDELEAQGYNLLMLDQPHVKEEIRMQ
jgi:hypothetical protein